MTCCVGGEVFRPLDQNGASPSKEGVALGPLRLASIDDISESLAVAEGEAFK